MATYLDHNATTSLDERVIDAMLPYMRDYHGNPSSVHRFGRAARQAIDVAREQVAALVNAHPSEVIFTSGGTEANNLAIKGYAYSHPDAPIMCSAVEHSSVIEPLAALTRSGWTTDVIPVDEHGRVSAETLSGLVQNTDSLVSVMMANNETGVIQDVNALSERVREAGSIMHCDAVQAVGKIPVDFRASGVHLMSVSAHKIYGPQGAGALIRDKAVELLPQLHGGGQEKGMRSGTENVAAIVGFGAAAELALQQQSVRHQQMQGLRDHLELRLKEIPGLQVFAQEVERLPNTSFFAVPGVDGETLLMQLDQSGFAVASGSACHSDSLAPGHVLLAMGVNAELARCTIRVSLGKDTLQRELDDFVACLQQQLGLLSRMALSVNQ